MTVLLQVTIVLVKSKGLLYLKASVYNCIPLHISPPLPRPSTCNPIPSKCFNPSVKMSFRGFGAHIPPTSRRTEAMYLI